ncbi:MAG: MlaD family protein [Planctomycetota bacterium]
MKEQTRNIVVGLTVLGALGMLCVMIVLLARLPGSLRRGYELDVLIDNTGGAKEGDSVYMKGLRVGYIERIQFHEARGIKMTARVGHTVTVPRTMVCYVTRNVLGPPYIELEEAPPSPLRDPKYLPDDSIYGQVREPSAVAELRPAVSNLAKIAEDLAEMMGPDDAADVPPEEAGLKGAVIRLNRTLDDFGRFAEEARRSTAAITKTATSAEENIEELTGRLVEAADNVSKLMTTFNRLAAQVESGEGSAGQFVNNPRLYRELVDSAEELTSLMKEMRELVAQWKKQGMTLKLK